MDYELDKAINSYEQITTPQLLLRVLEITDAPALQAMLATNKDYLMRWLPFLAEKEPETVLQKKEAIRAWKSEFYADESYRYGLFSRDNQQLVGICFLFTRQGKGILEIGYVIDEAHAGKGYATETSYALSKLGFQLLKTEKIVIVCSEGNVASAKVPQKLKFHLEANYPEVTKNPDGSRDRVMRWAIYQEAFQEFECYEPISFEQEEGW